MSWVATAVAGAAVVGAGASVYSSNKAADSQAQAAAQQSNATLAAAQLEDERLREFYDLARSDTELQRTVGEGALGQLAGLYGMSVDFGNRIDSPLSFKDYAQTEDAQTAALSIINDYYAEDARVSSMDYHGPNKYIKESAKKQLKKNYPIEVIRDLERFANGSPLSWQASQYLQRNVYSDYRENFEPYYDKAPSIEQGTSTADYSTFMNSPDYQFSFDEGMRAVNQSLAQQGKTGGGSQLKALTRFGQGLASQQLGNYKAGLAQLAGFGSSATNQTNNLGANTMAQLAAINTNATNATNSYLQNAGDARSSAYLNQGSAVQGVTNQVGNLAMLYGMGAMG